MNDAVRARKIADLIVGCETEYRGELLATVADDLRVNGQHRTAEILEFAVKHFEHGRPRNP